MSVIPLHSQSPQPSKNGRAQADVTNDVTQTELAELYSWRGGVLISIIKELRRGVCPQFSNQHGYANLTVTTH